MNIGRMMGLLLIAVIALPGCGDQRNTGQVNPAVARLLNRVPKDTPYVVVTGRKETLPTGLVEKLLLAQDLGIEQRKRSMGVALDGWRRAGILDEELATKLRRLFDALIEETAGKYSVEGWRSLGLKPNPHGVTYGLGLFPVVWQEIEDQARLEAFLGRVESRSGLVAQKRHWKNQEYRHFILGSLSILVAVRDGYLVLALLPGDVETSLLPRIFGEQQPSESLSGKSFARFAVERGFPGYMEGYVNTALILKEVRKAAARGEWPDGLPPGCTEVADGISRALPMVSLGLTEINEQRWQFSMILETTPDIVSRMKQIPAAVPGLGANSQALLNVGVGVNIPQLRDAINSSLRYVIKTGKGCRLVNEDVLTRAIQGISMGMNPMLAGVRGFNMNLDDLELDPDTLKPRKLEGSLVLAARDPAGMLGLLSPVAPELARMNVPADGVPVELSLGDKLPVSAPVFVAVKGDALAAAMGAEAASRVEKVLSQPASIPSPVFAMSVDVKRIWPLILLSLEKALQTQEELLRNMEKMAAESQDGSWDQDIQDLKGSLAEMRYNRDNVRQMFVQMARAYRRGGTWIYVTDHGLELRFVYDFNR